MQRNLLTVLLRYQLFGRRRSFVIENGRTIGGTRVQYAYIEEPKTDQTSLRQPKARMT
jgi:hypothetical protein